MMWVVLHCCCCYCCDDVGSAACRCCSQGCCCCLNCSAWLHSVLLLVMEVGVGAEWAASWAGAASVAASCHWSPLGHQEALELCSLACPLWRPSLSSLEALEYSHLRTHHLLGR